MVSTITDPGPNERRTWDDFVRAHPDGTLYHLSGWGRVIQTAYGHRTYFLLSQDEETSPKRLRSRDEGSLAKITGLLQVVHLKSRIFGNSLVSMPYFDFGGLLGRGKDGEESLVSEALKLAEQLAVNQIELRHTQPIGWLESPARDNLNPGKMNGWVCSTKKHKVRMLLNLPDSSAALMKSFPAKLRSQIRKPMKEGLKAKIGGRELLDDFYRVFCINMRDLGSPVHSSKLISAVLDEFPEESKIAIVEKDGRPLACSLMVGFRGTMENPWASALKEYSRLSPNMLLYWTMLEYSCDNGFKQFDFGRSTPGEGTCKFKEQWGAKPAPLHWQYIGWEMAASENGGGLSRRFDWAAAVWKRLPLAATRVFGPAIRKYISL